MRKSCTGEQQQQFKELEAHLNKYIEDKFAKNRLGTYSVGLVHAEQVTSLTQLVVLHSGHLKTH